MREPPRRAPMWRRYLRFWGPDADVDADVDDAVRAADPGLAVYDVRPMEERR